MRINLGDLMAYAVNDLNAVRNTLAELDSITALDAVTMLTLVLYQMLVNVDISLTLIAIIPMPLVAFVSIKMRRLIHIKFREKQESFAELTDEVQESISGIRVIKSFVQEEKEAEVFRQRAEDGYEKHWLTPTRHHGSIRAFYRDNYGCEYADYPAIRRISDHGESD